jgi:hypothetical protein
MFRTATGKLIRPTWVPANEDEPYWYGYWTMSREHLTAVAEAIAIRDGEVVIEMHYSQVEQCDQRCQNATGDDCTCSCEADTMAPDNTQHGARSATQLSCAELARRWLPGC